MNKYIIYIIAAFTFIIINSCSVSIPEKATAINNFDAEKYLGTWYEIARLDHKFERDLEQVTANYSMNDDGTIKVINKGFNPKKDKWKEAEGKAKFTEEENVGRLKVSFFGPFYGGYNIIELDENYQYALVAGSDLHYLWILSRTKTIPEEVEEQFLTTAREIGYETEDLIWVKQN